MTIFGSFKVGKKEFVIHAFHPTAFEKDIYAVNINQKGKPLVDRYTYFKQVKAKDAKEAMEDVRLEFLATLAKDMDREERFNRGAKKTLYA